MGLFITAAYAASDGKDSGGGMPQLATETYGSQIFWLVVCLVVLFFMLKNVALPKISGAIEARADAIEDDLDRAAELKRKAEEAEAAYDKALADARAKAQDIAADARAEIQKDLDAAVAKADAEISAKTAESEARIAEIRAGAMAAVDEVATDTAAALVGAVLPGAADAKAVKAAVAAKLKG